MFSSRFTLCCVHQQVSKTDSDREDAEVEEKPSEQPQVSHDSLESG